MFPVRVLSCLAAISLLWFPCGWASKPFRKMAVSVHKDGPLVELVQGDLFDHAKGGVLVVPTSADGFYGSIGKRLHDLIGNEPFVTLGRSQSNSKALDIKGAQGSGSANQPASLPSPIVVTSLAGDSLRGPAPFTAVIFVNKQRGDNPGELTSLTLEKAHDHVSNRMAHDRGMGDLGSISFPVLGLDEKNPRASDKSVLQFLHAIHRFVDSHGPDTPLRRIQIVVLDPARFDELAEKVFQVFVKAPRSEKR